MSFGMDDRPTTPKAQAYLANLQQTLKELQKKVHECEGQLNELRSRQHQLPQTPAGQIQLLTSALDHATNSEPFLPHPGSVLPALIALRKTHQTIIESRAFLASQAEDAETQTRHLETETAALRDHELLRQALAARIGALQQAEADADAGAGAGARAETQPEDATWRRIEEMQNKTRDYRKETSRLMKALNAFINEHLAAMLAAEELGGPVVGELMDVDPEDLVAGFSAQGRPKTKKKKEKEKEKEKEAGEGKRQRRIDEIWGRATTPGAEGQRTDEIQAAAAEMRRLTEELLNRLVEAGGSSGASYVQLRRESAAARFLIRSKVAEFHPKDATRIRLVDFGRELEE